MLVSEILQFPIKFRQIESELFTKDDSSHLCNVYQNMYNPNLTRKHKISCIKEILGMCDNVSKDGKKIICLLVFYVLKTEFGRSLLQENDKFRVVVFSRYEEFITEDDQDFVDAMQLLRI